MSLKEICQTLSREIQKLVPYDRVAIDLLEKDENYFSVYAEESRLPKSTIPEGVSVREGTATGWVFDHKEPLICRDVLKDSRFPLTRNRYKDVGLRSYLILPLIAKGNVLGSLHLGSRTPRSYSKKEIEILSPVAEILSLAIENSNLYEESHGQEEMQRLLKELSQDITSLDLDSLLTKLTEKVREFFKVDVCDVRLIENRLWRSLGASGSDPAQLVTSEVLGRSQWIVENRRPLCIADLNRESGTLYQGTLRRLGFRGYVGVPLFSKGQEVMGVLRALTYEPRDFTQEEVDLLEQLANGAAVAIENARLLHELKAKTQELESTNQRLNRLLQEQSALREIFAQISLLDLGHLLHQLTEQALKLLGVDHVQIRLLNEDGSLHKIAAAGKWADRVPSQVGMGRGRSTWVMENQSPLAIKDIRQDTVFGPGHFLRELGVKGYLLVPLISRGHKSIGVLGASTLKEKEFSQEEIALARQFAAGAAVAIENAKLLEEVQKKSRELEEAIEAKSDFLNTMAHELRTPLSVILGTQQLLKEGSSGELTEKQKKALEPIAINAHNLLSLINETLSLVRLEAKIEPLRAESFSLQEIINELASSFAPLAGEKGLELKFKVDGAVPALRSDRAKVREILQNLLGNAIKYTNKGEVELSASQFQEGQIALSVRDTGLGIKESDIPRIFEAFYIGEGVDRKQSPSTGLGLSIVKRQVELLRGQIEVQSQWGKGSTFTVSLPLLHPGES